MRRAAAGAIVVAEVVSATGVVGVDAIVIGVDGRVSSTGSVAVDTGNVVAVVTAAIESEAIGDTVSGCLGGFSDVFLLKCAIMKPVPR